MARFFFDVYDGERCVRDDIGIDLKPRTDMVRAAQDLLFDIGYAEMLNGRDRTFTVEVRNAVGIVVYRGEAVLKIERMNTNS